MLATCKSRVPGNSRGFSRGFSSPSPYQLKGMHVDDVLALLHRCVVVADVRLAGGVDRADDGSGGDRHFLRLVDHAERHRVGRRERGIVGHRALPDLTARRGSSRRLEAGVLRAGLERVAADLVEAECSLRLATPKPPRAGQLTVTRESRLYHTSSQMRSGRFRCQSLAAYSLAG